MEPLEFPQDFSEFLRLLNDHNVEYLLVGGFAVAFYGYPRATAEMDVWVSRRPENAERIVSCLRAFGFEAENLTPELFESPNRVVRMGVAPLRIEVLTDIDGVAFDECAARAETFLIGTTPVPLISLADLKQNKRASGRPKDMDDLEHLP